MSAWKYFLIPFVALLLLLAVVVNWVPACHSMMSVWRISPGSIPARGAVEFFSYNTYCDGIGRADLQQIMKYADTRITQQLGVAPFLFDHQSDEIPLDDRESTVWQLPKGYVCLTYWIGNDSHNLSLSAGDGDFLKKNKGEVYTPGKPTGK